MTDKSHTLAKVLFVLGWIGLVGLGWEYGEDFGLKSRVVEIVRAQIVTTARTANSLLPIESAASTEAR